MVKKYMKKIRKNISSKMQIILTMMIFVAPLLLFLFTYNVYTINILKNKLAETGQNTINVYQNPFERELRNTEGVLVDIVANDIDFQQLIYSTKKVDIYIYTQNVMNKIKRIFSTSTAVAGCYVYNETEDFIQETYQGSYSYMQKSAMKQFLKECVNKKGNVLKGGWMLKEIEGTPFLFRVFQKSNSYIMGVFDLNRVDKPQFYENSSKDSFLFFADEKGNPITSKQQVHELDFILQEASQNTYYISGNRQKYLLVSNKLDKLDLTLIYATPYYGLLMYFEKMPLFFLGVSMLAVLLILISFKVLEKTYLNPLVKLVDTMEAIKSGNIEAKMEYENHIIEFSVLSNTFNEMMEDIKLLKISAYEYQIETQQAKLQYLQIQIRPHFFLNCLKNLYALAQEEKYVQIQDTILALSNHLRYILKDNFSLVPIEMELQSVKNYILLQQLSSSYQISCNIEFASQLKGFQIPPLSILTFIENSVKHAKGIHKHLKIQVKIDTLKGEENKFINITILDNGNGFSEESLQYLNQTTNMKQEEQHIGIQNVKHRFSLIYHNECTFSFANTTSGASIEIFIPTILKENIE